MPSDQVDDPRPWAAADWRWAAGLFAVAFALYVRTGGYDIIYFDDQSYVANNGYVRQGLSWAGVRWACTGTVVDNWHPLTLLLSLTVSTAFGATAGVFHLTNTVLFAADVALLFAFLRSATGRTGAAVAAAALWGFHPLRVESVAWVAELKDVLCGAMALACLSAYVAYARRRTVWRYLGVVALLALALLSKPTAVTLPFVLLLCDLWPLGTRPFSPGRQAADRRPPAAAGTTSTANWWLWRVAEKLPLFALAAAVAVITVRSQSKPSVLVSIPWPVRLGNAAVSIAAYLRTTVWPTGLGVFYPHPWVLRHPIPPAAIATSVALIASLTIAIGVAGRRRYLTVGWLWFLGMLIPVLGLLQAGDQARADRFTLLPGIGLTVAAVWLAADLLAPRRKTAIVITSVIVGLLLVCTVRQTSTWQSVDTAWERADAVIPENYMARSFRAQIALADRKLPEAERLAREAITLVPRSSSDPHHTLAQVLDAGGRPAEAAVEFAAAIRIAPDDSLLRRDAGQFFARQRDLPAARRELTEAVRLNPAMVDARRALAVALAAGGLYADAADQFRRVLALSPDDAAARAGLADAVAGRQAASQE